MALTEFQRRICRLIAQDRVARGESYLAGGAALNVHLDASRLSHDLDLFHDRSITVLFGKAADPSRVAFSIEYPSDYDTFTAYQLPAYPDFEYTYPLYNGNPTMVNSTFVVPVHGVKRDRAVQAWLDGHADEQRLPHPGGFAGTVALSCSFAGINGP